MTHSLLHEQSTPLAATWRPIVIFCLLIAYFSVLGLSVGAQGIVWADMIVALQLGPGAFGTAQLVSPLCGVLILLSIGPLSTWAGKKSLCFTGLALLMVGNFALAWVTGFWTLVGALAVLGTGIGLLDGTMNGATLDWERATGRTVMSLLHASFSGAAVVGALGAGALLTWGWDYRHIFILLAALCGVAGVVTIPTRFPPVEMSEEAMSGPGATLRLFFSQRALMILALLGFLGIIGEVVANLWSVIYLRELGAEALIGGVAFALFNGAMFIGRLLNQPLVARRGARTSLLLSGLLVLVSSALLLLPTQSIPLAIAAFALMGLAVAGVIPTVLGVADRVAPGQSGAVAGGIMAAVYAAVIVCAPLVGWIAELYSLQAALLTVLLSGVGILVMTWKQVDR